MYAQADRVQHQVLEVLGERLRAGSVPGHRADDLRIALAIEGGGMRGTVSAGMALALHELGLVPAFDAVYGASAGAITGAWLLSSNPDGLRGWAEPSYAKTLIRWSSLLRGRPVVDVRTLIEVVYQTEFPMDFASVLASPVEYHPLATDAATGASTDLGPLIGDPAGLRLALRASASLPFLAGPPVRLDGRRFYDAGVSESIPFRTPLAQGATHIMVLRTRIGPLLVPAADALAMEAVLPRQPPAPGPVPAPRRPRPPRSTRLLARTTLRNESPELRAALLTRRRRRPHRRTRGRRARAVHPALGRGPAGQPPDHRRPPARGRLRGGAPGRPGHIQGLAGVIQVTSRSRGGTIGETASAGPGATPWNPA